MDDPNIAYKRAFADLEAKLGRPPTTRDDGWLAIGNEYSRSWGPAQEEDKRDGSNRVLHSGTQADISVLRDEAREALDGRPSPAPLSAPRTIQEPAGAESPPEATRAAPRGSERAMVGSRGPSGGIMAACVTCGRAWERERRRGRPSAMCEECR